MQCVVERARLVLLRDGAILADGKPENIIALPEIGETYRVSTDLDYPVGARFMLTLVFWPAQDRHTARDGLNGV